MQQPRPLPTRVEVRERLLELIYEIAKIPADRIGDDATLENDIRMESVAFVELQVALEDEYGVEIDPIEVVELNEFGAIVDYVHRIATNGPA